MSEMDKYYQILGLNPGTLKEEIKEAYKDLQVRSATTR